MSQHKENFLDKFRYSYDSLEEITDGNKKEVYIKKKGFKNPQLRSLLANSVKVSKEVFPIVQKSIDEVFSRLKIQNNFLFFVTANNNETQAMCSMMPQSDNAEIIITSRMIDLLNPEELQSVIGHEVSHFYYQHSLYPNPLKAGSRLEFLNLLHLSRAAEISADRAGFLGSGSLENSLRGMLKITSGLGDKHLNFNFTSYLDQLRELHETPTDKIQLYSTHPTFLNRIQALIWFSMSHEYHEHFETNKKGVYDLKTVDDKINESIKKVTGGEIDIYNKEIIDKALLWGTLRIYLSDKKFSKKEQENFTKLFGEKAIVSVKSLLNITKMSIIEKRVDEAFHEAQSLMKTDKEKIINKLEKVFGESDNISEGKIILQKLKNKLQ